MNVILNLFLIPIFKQNGAAATTVISEYFVLLYCLKKDDGNIKMFLSFHEAFHSLLQALCGVLTVIVTTVLIKQLDFNYLLCLALIVIISVVVYGIELLLLGNTLVIDILQKIRARIHHV
jgi:peptidoglycan biosynthesis protein MviN/MurJ (putative lipid II flippase)